VIFAPLLLPTISPSNAICRTLASLIFIIKLCVKYQAAYFEKRMVMGRLLNRLLNNIVTRPKTMATWNGFVPAIF
jgi:hypothetical protein